MSAEEKVEQFQKECADLDYSSDNIVFYCNMLLRTLREIEENDDEADIIDHYTERINNYARRYIRHKRALRRMLAENPLWQFAAEATGSVILEI